MRLDGPYNNNLYDGPYIGCKHMRLSRDMSGDRVCAAFPDGIPLRIWRGETDHDRPRPDLGQENYVVFEPMPRLLGGR